MIIIGLMIKFHLKNYDDTGTIGGSWYVGLRAANLCYIMYVIYVYINKLSYYFCGMGCKRKHEIYKSFQNKLFYIVSFVMMYFNMFQRPLVLLKLMDSNFYKIFKLENFLKYKTIVIEVTINILFIIKQIQYKSKIIYVFSDNPHSSALCFLEVCKLLLFYMYYIFCMETIYKRQFIKLLYYPHLICLGNNNMNILGNYKRIITYVKYPFLFYYISIAKTTNKSCKNKFVSQNKKCFIHFNRTSSIYRHLFLKCFISNKYQDYYCTNYLIVYVVIFKICIVYLSLIPLVFCIINYFSNGRVVYWNIKR